MGFGIYDQVLCILSISKKECIILRKINFSRKAIQNQTQIIVQNFMKLKHKNHSTIYNALAGTHKHELS